MLPVNVYEAPNSSAYGVIIGNRINVSRNATIIIIYMTFAKDIPAFRFLLYMKEGRGGKLFLSKESVKFLRELSSPFVLGCFSKFIQMSCFTGFHFRRTLSAGTASASSLVKNTLCGVRGLVLFPQESPPYVPARQCSMLKIDVALVRRVFYFKNQPSHVKLSHKAYSDPCWLMQAFGHG